MNPEEKKCQESRTPNRGYTLCADHIRISRGKKEIIKDLSFSCEPGLVGLLGPNGSGKTTLMRGMLHLGVDMSGEVTLKRRESGSAGGGDLALGSDAGPAGGGHPADSEESLRISELPAKARSRYFAYVPQEMAAGEGFTVRDFAVMGRTPYLSLLKNPGKAEYAAADGALAALGITGLSGRKVNTLSGGEKRMVYLARARAQGAEWMFLDEPASGLDFGRQQQFFGGLVQFLKQGNFGAVASIHDPLLAYTFCDQILILKDGMLSASLKKTDRDFETEFIRKVGRLYGMEGYAVEVPAGKTILWRCKDGC